jgi:uncharacterized protein YndB with AHSA1/START domain
MSQLPQKIWRALTQGPLIEEWLMPVAPDTCVALTGLLG